MLSSPSSKKRKKNIEFYRLNYNGPRCKYMKQMTVLTSKYNKIEGSSDNLNVDV